MDESTSSAPQAPSQATKLASQDLQAPIGPICSRLRPHTGRTVHGALWNAMRISGAHTESYFKPSSGASLSKAALHLLVGCRALQEPRTQCARTIGRPFRRGTCSPAIIPNSLLNKSRVSRAKSNFEFPYLNFYWEHFYLNLLFKLKMPAFLHN